MPKKALGKGLEALIPKSVVDSINAERIVEIPLSDVQANPYQPRRSMDDETLKELAASIERDGVLQPVVVRRKGAAYQLIMGERRLQAARIAGKQTIPAVVKEAGEAEALRLALVENIQREELNPLDLALAYKRLGEEFGLSQQEIARLVGRDRSSVANTLRLLALPEPVREMLRQGRITEGHARAVLSVPDERGRLELAQRIVRENLSVRRSEKEAASAKGPARQGKEKPPHIVYLERALSQHLGTKVVIEEKRGGRGRIIVEFYSHDDFERLAGIMHLPMPR